MSSPAEARKQVTYYDTIGYKTIYRDKYLSYECEHIVQSFSIQDVE